LEPTNDPKKLKEQLAELLREREGIVKEASDPAAPGEAAKLRKQLLDTLSKLEQQKKAPPPAAHPDPKNSGGDDHPPKKFELPTDKPPLDAVRLALGLYKTGDLDAALRAFKLIDTSVLTKEDRAFAQYLTAGCLRKTGKVSEALALYRDVAEAKEDAFLTECALWQIGAIRSAQELETQLEQLRARRKSK
jgi:tetratricopeptide (TPR) repeat protein